MDLPQPTPTKTCPPPLLDSVVHRHGEPHNLGHVTQGSVGSSRVDRDDIDWDASIPRSANISVDDSVDPLALSASSISTLAPRSTQCSTPLYCHDPIPSNTASRSSSSALFITGTTSFDGKPSSSDDRARSSTMVISDLKLSSTDGKAASSEYGSSSPRLGPTATAEDCEFDVCLRTHQIEDLARTILDEAFNIRLGRSKAPAEIIEAVRVCLGNLSVSVRHSRQMGYLAAYTSAAPSETSSSNQGASGSAPETTSWKRSNNRNKRNLGVSGEDDNDLQDEDSDEDELPGGPSRTYHRKRAKNEQFPCPFRKRNPLKFNCRDWEYCAKGAFKDMSELKKHILKYHLGEQSQPQYAYKCPRCYTGFTFLEDMMSHLRVEKERMCKAVTVPTSEDGVSPSLEARLRGRKEHFIWKTLCYSLFGDDDLPSPEFEPVVELHEIKAQYFDAIPQFQQLLSSTINTLLPARSPNANHLLRGPLENMFKEFVASLFQGAQDQAGKSLPAKSSPRRLSVENSNPVNPASQDVARAPSALSAAAGPGLRAILPFNLPNTNGGQRVSHPWTGSTVAFTRSSTSADHEWSQRCNRDENSLGPSSMHPPAAPLIAPSIIINDDQMATQTKMPPSHARDSGISMNASEFYYGSIEDFVNLFPDGSFGCEPDLNCPASLSNTESNRDVRKDGWSGT